MNTSAPPCWNTNLTQRLIAIKNYLIILNVSDGIINVLLYDAFSAHFTLKVCVCVCVCAYFCYIIFCYIMFLTLCCLIVRERWCSSVPDPSESLFPCINNPILIPLSGGYVSWIIRNDEFCFQGKWRRCDPATVLRASSTSLQSWTGFTFVWFAVKVVTVSARQQEQIKLQLFKPGQVQPRRARWVRRCCMLTLLSDHVKHLL